MPTRGTRAKARAQRLTVQEVMFGMRLRRSSQLLPSAASASASISRSERGLKYAHPSAGGGGEGWNGGLACVRSSARAGVQQQPRHAHAHALK